MPESHEAPDAARGPEEVAELGSPRGGESTGGDPQPSDAETTAEGITQSAHEAAHNDISRSWIQHFAAHFPGWVIPETWGAGNGGAYTNHTATPSRIELPQVLDDEAIAKLEEFLGADD